MCSIFGMVGFENQDEGTRLRLVEEIGVGGESRGKEATGITAIFQNKKTYLNKENVGASKFDWADVPSKGLAYQGHTRFSTGSPVNWKNNHPFVTLVDESYRFTVTHNGMISNDYTLKRDKNLDDGGVKCDSYVVNLLLENVMFTSNKDRLDIDIVKEVAELLKGSYSIVIMDNEGRLFFFRNSNPCKIIQNDKGLIWASTKGMITDAEEILNLDLGIITETKKEYVYEYSVAEKDFINVQEFKASYGYGNYNWQNYSGYNKSKSKSKKTTRKTSSKDGDFIWFDTLSGNYFYFKNNDEFADFLRGNNDAGELITDKEVLKTLEKRYCNNFEEIEETVMCPMCQEDVLEEELYESTTRSNATYAELKSEHDKMNYWYVCPECKAWVTQEELKTGVAYGQFNQTKKS